MSEEETKPVATEGEAEEQTAADTQQQAAQEDPSPAEATSQETVESQQQEAESKEEEKTEAVEEQKTETEDTAEAAKEVENGGEEEKPAEEALEEKKEEVKEEDKKEEEKEEQSEAKEEEKEDIAVTETQEQAKSEEDKEQTSQSAEVEETKVEEEEKQQTTEQEVEVVLENGVVNGQAEEESTKEAVTLSEEEKQRCTHFFEKKAVDGRLDLKGFKVLFRLMGELLSSEDADVMFKDGGSDAERTIDCEEFCRLYCKFRQAEQDRKDALASSIEKLFPMSDGQPVELKKVEGLLLKLQQPDLSMRLVREKSDLGQDDVRRLVKAMDKQGTGRISRQEFVETLCGHLQM